MTIGFIHTRLLDYVRECVRNGALTESHLARLTGVSQPHIHNVLKGVRVLSTELADEFLAQLRINVEELVKVDADGAAAHFRAVPLLSGALGPGMKAFLPGHTAGTAFIPAAVVVGVHLPVAAWLAEDELMCPRYTGGDLIVIDQASAARTHVSKNGAYVVATSSGPRIRYLRLGGTRLYVLSEECIQKPSRWESVPVSGTAFLDIVKGRVVWVSRHLRRAG